MHRICRIQPALIVDQQRPLQPRLLNVALGHPIVVKGDNVDSQAKLFEFRIVMPQLRHVLAARKSAEVPVEYKKPPIPSGVRQLVLLAAAIQQFEIDSRTPYQAPKFCFHRLRLPNDNCFSPNSNRFSPMILRLSNDSTAVP